MLSIVEARTTLGYVLIMHQVKVYIKNETLKMLFKNYFLLFYSNHKEWAILKENKKE